MPTEKVLVTREKLDFLANAIGDKSGESIPMTIDEMISAVNGISGGEQVEVKQVTFIDYDGTVLYSYTLEEANALTALPDNPSHQGLTAQGWNWTLAQIKAQLTAVPEGDVVVGQMYTTASGDTEIDVRVSEAKDPSMALYVNGTITINWGDGTSLDTVTGNNYTSFKSASHTYAASGDYTIKIHATTGSFVFGGTAANSVYKFSIFYKNSSYANLNYVYADIVRAIRCGPGLAFFSHHGFSQCRNMEYITIPNTVTSIEAYALNFCQSLKGIVIPNSVTQVGKYALYALYSVNFLSLPPTITTVDERGLSSANALKALTIPNGITSTGQYAFAYLYNVEKVAIPPSLTTPGESLFYGCSNLTEVVMKNTLTTISYNTFYDCRCVQKFVVPASVTTIGNSVFTNTTGVKEYHFLSTVPPSLGTGNIATTSGNIQPDCKVYVPTASLSDYQSATNWSNLSSRMVGE